MGLLTVIEAPLQTPAQSRVAGPPQAPVQSTSASAGPVQVALQVPQASVSPSSQVSPGSSRPLPQVAMAGQHWAQELVLF